MIVSGPVTLASRNEGKLRELRALAGDALDLQLLPAGAPDVEEDGATYFENARKKADSAARFVGGAALADDSGLEVDGLGGAPGVRSARFGGPGLDDAGRVAHLLAQLGASKSRTARFRCVLVLTTGREIVSAEGVLEGELAGEPRGSGGFGYDPIFLPSGWGGRTLAELAPAEKNRISHRAAAFRALLERLR